jgi:hypothetical protein
MILWWNAIAHPFATSSSCFGNICHGGPKFPNSTGEGLRGEGCAKHSQRCKAELIKPYGPWRDLAQVEAATLNWVSLV